MIFVFHGDHSYHLDENLLDAESRNEIVDEQEHMGIELDHDDKVEVELLRKEDPRKRVGGDAVNTREAEDTLTMHDMVDSQTTVGMGRL